MHIHQPKSIKPYRRLPIRNYSFHTLSQLKHQPSNQRILLSIQQPHNQTNKSKTLKTQLQQSCIITKKAKIHSKENSKSMITLARCKQISNFDKLKQQAMCLQQQGRFIGINQSLQQKTNHIINKRFYSGKRTASQQRIKKSIKKIVAQNSSRFINIIDLEEAYFLPIYSKLLNEDKNTPQIVKRYFKPNFNKKLEGVTETSQKEWAQGLLR